MARSIAIGLAGLLCGVSGTWIVTSREVGSHGELSKASLDGPLSDNWRNSMLSALPVDDGLFLIDGEKLSADQVIVAAVAKGQSIIVVEIPKRRLKGGATAIETLKERAFGNNIWVAEYQHRGAGRGFYTTLSLESGADN